MSTPCAQMYIIFNNHWIFHYNDFILCMDGEIMMATNAGQSLTNQILTDSSIGSPQQNA